jgi:hypothetical protein
LDAVSKFHYGIPGGDVAPELHHLEGYPHNARLGSTELNCPTCLSTTPTAPVESPPGRA